MSNVAWKRINRDVDLGDYIGVMVWVDDKGIRDRLLDMIDKDTMDFTVNDRGKLIGKVLSDKRMVLNIRKDEVDRLIGIVDEYNLDVEWNITIPEEKYSRMGDSGSIRSVIIGAYRDGRRIVPLWIPREGMLIKEGDVQREITAVYNGNRFMVCVGWLDGYELYRVSVMKGRVKIERISEEGIRVEHRDNIRQMIGHAMTKLFNPNISYALNRRV